MFSSDPEKTARRIQRLARYLDASVMELSCLGGPFVCRHASACRASVPNAAFHEGQMSHIGEHYDLFEDGCPLRIVVVGQEVGTDEEYIGLLARRQQVLTGSGRTSAYYKADDYRSRNPHMRGTTSALRLLLGRDPGEDRDREFIELASGERIHLFDAFTLVNVLLCSAHKTGTKNGVSSSTMRDNCIEHFAATLRVLEPTVIVVQGIGTWQWIRNLFEFVEPLDDHSERCRFDGHEVVVARFTHPSAHGDNRWGDRLDAEYLCTTVAPTLTRVREAMTNRTEKSLTEEERIAALLPFVGRFDAPGSWGKWAGGKQSNGTIHWPWFDYSEDASAFIDACYKGGWVLAADWREWTDEAIRLRDNPALFADADALTIARCLTAYIRGDRFTEGVVAECFETGAISAILRRFASVAGRGP